MPFIVLLLVAPGWGHPSDFEVSRPVEFRLQHSTRVTVEEGVQILRVYHAVPKPGSWSGHQHRPRSARLTPSSGREELNSDAPGSSWKWEMKNPLAGEYEFVSRFRVRSAHRRLRADRLQVDWRRMLAVPPRSAVVGDLAQQLRRPDPLETVRAISRWIHDNSAYDANMTQDFEDLAATLKAGRGHCGHHAFLFLELARQLGIPCRWVAGFSAGKEGNPWRPDYDGNRHYWVEVRLPEVGWVEVEPRTAGDPFHLPAGLIRNPSYQSVVVWVLKDGKWSVSHQLVDRLNWTAESGWFVDVR